MASNQHALSETRQWEWQLTISSAARANGGCSMMVKPKMSTRRKKRLLRPPGRGVIGTSSRPRGAHRRAGPRDRDRRSKCGIGITPRRAAKDERTNFRSRRGGGVHGDCVLSRERGAQRHLSFDDIAQDQLALAGSQQHGSTPGKAKLLRFQAPRQGALVPDHYRDIDLGSVGGHAVL